MMTEESTTGNSRLPQWGLMWLNQEQCFYQSMCLVDPEASGHRNRHLCLAPKRHAN